MGRGIPATATTRGTQVDSPPTLLAVERACTEELQTPRCRCPAHGRPSVLRLSHNAPSGVSRVASGLLCLHAVATTPAGSMELVRSSLSIVSGLPCVTVRSAPAIVFSGHTQRSLTLRPARSRSRPATLSIESSDSFVASAAVSIATGWSEPVPGRELHPLKSSAFPRRTVTSAANRASRLW